MEQCVSIFITLAVMAFSVSPAIAQSKAGGFDKLKTLVGEWEGKGPDGKTAKLTYQLISGGTALMETFLAENEPPMVTIYHPNGDKLMMTHYCSAGNQPRMQAQVPAGEIKTLQFAFFDVANMSKHSEGHISSLGLTFQDSDHITQEWGWRDKDNKDMVMKANFTRKK